MENRILRLHHITALANQAKRNLDFYTQVLGVRFIKKTINFDDPGTYHFCTNLARGLDAKNDTRHTPRNSGFGGCAEQYPVKEVQFRKVAADCDYDFHCAPQKQYIVLPDGGVEIQTSLGETRQFSTSEILLFEDTTEKGHKTKNLERRERTSLFIHNDTVRSGIQNSQSNFN